MSDVCSICHADLTDGYELPDCGHRYHMNCIVQWFRSYSSRCPLCNGEPSVADVGWRDRYNAARAHANSGSATVEMRRVLWKLRRAEEKLRDALRERAVWARTAGPVRDVLIQRRRHSAVIRRRKGTVHKYKRRLTALFVSVTIHTVSVELCRACRTPVE